MLANDIGIAKTMSGRIDRKFHFIERMLEADDSSDATISLGDNYPDIAVYYDEVYSVILESLRLDINRLGTYGVDCTTLVDRYNSLRKETEGR